VILWCDSIREEYEELLSYCQQMQQRVDDSIFEEDEICAFTKSVFSIHARVHRRSVLLPRQICDFQRSEFDHHFSPRHDSV
jgi:hypothetical protein